MELKYKLEDMGNSKDYSSNRTFMELKFWNDAGGKMGIWF